MNEQASSLQISSGSWIKVNVGAISLDEVKNIARELKYIWKNLDNLSPKAELRVTVDASGRYSVHLNGRAVMYMLLFCKDIAELKPEPVKQGPEMPPMPADFLVFDSVEDSTPGLAGPDSPI